MLSTVSPRHHIPVLDSFRGIFALLVVIFHFPAVYWGASLPFVRHGYLAVDFFFVLSGFVLTRGYANRMAGGSDLVAFFRDRVVRLVPLHLIGLILAMALTFMHHIVKPMTAQSVGIGDFLSTLTLTHSLGLGSSRGLNEPSWSLSAEMIAYVLFGMILLATALRPRLRIVLMSAFAAIGLIGILDIGADNSGQMLDITHLGIYRGLFGFFLGALLQRLLARVPLPATGKATAGLLEAVVLAAFLVTYTMIDTATLNTLLIYPAIIALIAIFAQSAGGLSTALSAEPLIWLGRRSYALYILHFPILGMLLPVIRAALARLESFGPLVSVGAGTLMMLGTAALTLWVADLAHRHVEKRLKPFARAQNREGAATGRDKRRPVGSNQALSARP